MRLQQLISKKVAVGAVGAIAVLGIGGTAYAATNPSSGSSAATTPQAAPAAVSKSGLGAILRRTDHATLEVKVKGQWVTYTLDRGKVTAVSPTSITLARPDGESVTEAITSNTKYRGVTSEAGIQVDKSAIVLSQNGTALGIRQARPSAT
jgi:outer membrane lipoprotein SlyB